MSTKTYVLPVDPVQGALGMHEWDPSFRSRLTETWGKYTFDVSLGAKTHRKNSVVTGGQA